MTLAVSASLAHDATMLNLAPHTTYYYCIHATDLAGNASSSCGHSVTTAASEIIIDTLPPAVTLEIVSVITSSSASVTWTTDQLAEGYVEYGTTNAYGSETSLQTDFALSHMAPVSGLSANMTYHYRIHSRDASGNTMVTPDNTFMTSPVAGVVPEPTTTAPVTVTPTVSTTPTNTGAGTTVTTPVGSTSISTPADTTPPIISGVLEASIDSVAVSIGWTTNELAISTLTYGTTLNYGNSATLPLTAVLVHDATLTNLAPSTTYYYCIHTTDLAGNMANSCGHTFITSAAPVITAPADTTSPAILAAAATGIMTTSANIMWTTSEAADTQVEYGTTSSYGSETALNSSFTLSGSVPLANLTPNTIYHFRVRSYDAAGNLALGTDQTFTTGALPISTPTTTVTVPETTTSTTSNTTITTPNLVISSVAADSISETGATITWTTDLPSDSRVTYGDAGEFDETAGSATLTTSHSVTLTGLDSDTTYQFRVESAPVGVGAVETVSGGHDFTTLAQPIVLDPPANILTVSSSQVTGTGASVSFTTDESTHGSIEYGLTTSYGETTADTSLETSHAVTLSSLLPGTTYHFRVKAIDQTDNVTYSIDHEFTTPGIGVGVSTPSSTEASSIISVSTLTGSSVSSGETGIAAPAIVTVTPADDQIVFIVNPQETAGDSTVIAVRGDGTYPTSPTDGQIVYDGNAATFTDTNVTNGSTYDYSVYTRNSNGGYSSAVHIAARPVAGVEQVQLDRNPVLEPAIAIQHFGSDISIGTQSEEVIHLQQLLNTESLHPSALTTGYFGSLTLASLKRFQAKYNLPQTGVVDATTRPVLNSISQGWMLLGAPTGLGDLTIDIKPGDTGQNVADLQTFLAYEGSYEEGNITATYGPLTKESVADFQKKFGVTPVSGIVGPKTRHTIQTVLGQ